MEKNSIVSVGIFFDGTGNNGINATSGRKPSSNNESYYNSTTNIYKLFNLFQGNEKIYIEGIGTLTGAEDSNFAMATCKNPVGYIGYSSDDKLARAFAFIQDKMEDRSKEYQFYVYGFSRGAMLARNLCYELLKPDSRVLGNVKVKFLGVFDTVESTPFNDYSVSLLPEVENAVHLCAVNECRYFFPLTGFFEDSKNMDDSQLKTGTSVWKEIFVPGAHADAGGGYLEASQSVYVSPNFMRIKDVETYIANVRNTMRDSGLNKIWNSLLENYKIDSGGVFSQAYVARNMVYNDLSKVYGRLILTQTNAVTPVFSTDFSAQDFEIDSVKHPFLITFSDQLEKYAVTMDQALKPVYNYEQFVPYTHISANFGLYSNRVVQKSQNGIDAELINNGMNIPSHATVDTIHPRFKSEIHLLEDGSVTDFAYGANVPNNDIWDRSILIK
ncbi:T6SS phospholipase effector Tle1-like catalytic domain-containing protein [Chryseobacterium tongliaoense]|uniref:T6SS phospholipase effector Tle1-like catalytic domain-containing protein n=1 Tax=Chryseobacterium tongliaoense TaxID=3240933 RepID=UPI003519C25D